MRFTRRLSFSIFLAAILLLAAAPRPASAQEARIEILFDFGDGSYIWSSAAVSSEDATNATWDAIRRAADLLGVPIESAWFSCCGVAILDVGGRGSPSGFVGIYLWNETSGQWELTSEGVSSLRVKDGDRLALYNAGFDSVTYESRAPVPRPSDRLPSFMFRGDASNRGVSLSRAPDVPRVLWDRDTEVKEIGSTPAVAYGRLFVATLQGLVALDAGSGQARWTNPDARGFSSPAVFDDSVFVGSSDGRVYRVNATDGTVEWSTSLLESTGFSGITSSPKIVFDWVFIGTFNETGGPGEVVALWASNGTVRWRVPTGSVHFSSPAYADGTVYVGIAGTYNTTTQITFDPPYGILALDAATGDERWFLPTTGSISASPAVVGSYLVAPSKDGNVYAVDRATGSLLWQRAVGAGVASPAIVEDAVFVGGGAFGGQGRVVALDLATGSQRWSFTPNGPVQASLTFADGKIFFATNTATGTVYALNASTGGLVWEFTPSPAQFILSSPVVANGAVYAASDNGHVYAIGEVVPPPDAVGTLALVGLAASAIAAVAILAAIVARRRRPPRGP